MARPIFDTLRMLHGGMFLDECSEKLAEAVKQVDETGKAGKLTITLDLKKNGGAINVLAKVTNKVPESAPDAALSLIEEVRAGLGAVPIFAGACRAAS